jgi:hypothetical protein
MAKRRGDVNKSEKIREYYGQHKRAKPAEVVAALGEQGISVTSQLVSNTRSRMGVRRKKRRKATNRRVGRPRAANSYQALFEAKAFVAKAGSVDKARAALDALAKLQ